jgi:hypothetical protein
MKRLLAEHTRSLPAKYAKRAGFDTPALWQNDRLMPIAWASCNPRLTKVTTELDQLAGVRIFQGGPTTESALWRAPLSRGPQHSVTLSRCPGRCLNGSARVAYLRFLYFRNSCGLLDHLNSAGFDCRSGRPHGFIR